MSAIRIEKDALGELAVPADALFGIQTLRAVGNFAISGRTAHPELIRAYLQVKRAAASANHACGALDAETQQQITRAIDELLEMPIEEWATIFPVDPYQAGAGTSQNMNANEVVANLANLRNGSKLGLYQPVHPNDHVNRSQSTNDSFPTAMRIAILDASRAASEELLLLSQSFNAKAHLWMDLPKSARTHLQDAVPMTLGQEIRAYGGTVLRTRNWIEQGRDSLRELGIGGSAAGTGLTVPTGYADYIVEELSRLTGEKLRPSQDLCESMQSQSPVMHYSSMLRLVALELTRICNDLRLLASGPMTGLAEIRLPEVQPGSSIMPGKVNPSILEMANQACFSIIGYDQTVALSTQAGQLELNVMMPMMAYSCLEATRVLTRTVHTLRVRCIEGLEANADRMRFYFESTPQVATALNPILGYSRVAELVKESIAQGKSVISIVRERNLVDEKVLSELLEVKRLTGRS